MSSVLPMIKPAFVEDNIPVVLSTDENYLPYVQVVINSIKANSKVGNLDFLIFHSGISVEKITNTIKRYVGLDRISVRFIDISGQKNSSILSGFKKTGRLPVSALYRLLAPVVMSEYNKAIYLDVDTIVCRDVADLYAFDLEDSLFASAVDMVQIIKPEYIAWARSYDFTEWNSYINTGVMVMNLDRLRDEIIADKLLTVALDAAAWACDQDAFNFVCKGQIKILDPRWNVQVGDYCIAKQLAKTKNEGWIYHFTENPKPWDRPEHLFANFWWANEDMDSGIELWRKIYGSGPSCIMGAYIAVSLIIPIHNAAAYLPMMLISLAAQTLHNIEIICVDTGSDDGSLDICSRFALFDDRFRVFSQRNSNTAEARNRGIVEAKGRWLFFANDKDFCKPDMLERMLAAGEKQNHDIIVSGHILLDCMHQGFSCVKNIPKSFLNHIGVINSHTEPLNIFSGAGFVLSNKLFKAEFIRRKKLWFNNLSFCGDIHFIFASLLSAESISFVEDSYYFNRVNLPDGQAISHGENPVDFLNALRDVKELFEYEEPYLQKQFCCAVIAICFNHLFTKRMPDDRRAIFEALRNGGLTTILFSSIDMDELDLGKYKKVYNLMRCGADLIEILTEYYAAEIDNFLDLCGESQKRLRRIDAICNDLSRMAGELCVSNRGEEPLINELNTISSSMSFQVNRLRTVVMELANVSDV